MTLTHYINAFPPPCSTAEQVLENKQKFNNLIRTVPRDRADTIQINVTRKMGKTMSHAKPRISSMAFFKKIGLG